MTVSEPSTPPPVPLYRRIAAVFSRSVRTNASTSDSSATRRRTDWISRAPIHLRRCRGATATS